MDSLQQVMLEHEAWYDSGSQDWDSWGCVCDHIARYRTREDVIDKHIMPKLRAARDQAPELRPQDQGSPPPTRTKIKAEARTSWHQTPQTRARRSIDANGNVRTLDDNGRLIRANTEKHAWEDYERLLEHLKGLGMNKISSALEDYEEERIRLGKAVQNLDEQLDQLVAGYTTAQATYQKLVRLLAEAGLDAETMLRTDEVFADPDRQDSPARPIYCQHGQDMEGSCSQCNRVSKNAVV